MNFLAIAAFTIINMSSHPEAEALLAKALEGLEVQGVEVVIMDRTHMLRVAQHEDYHMEAFILDTPLTKLLHLYIDPDLPKARLWRVLKHEAVHIWQISTGRLSISDRPHIHWEGNTYFTMGKDYYGFPWEKEARRLARTL